MATTYALDNLDQVVLQRTFDYRRIDNMAQRMMARISRHISGKRDVITLKDVYNAFAANKTFPEIQEEFENITPKTILLGRAFYMAANPNEYAHRRQQYLRVLCDANVDASYLTDGARQVFGYATHIDFEGLTDAKDSRIWARANGRYNLIVTKDKAVKKSRKSMAQIDLTRCAILRWKYILQSNGGIVDDGIRGLPVLVHVMDARLKGHEIKNLLRKHRDTIFEIYDERVSPVIELHRDKACPGIRIPDILGQKLNIIERERRDILVAGWLNKVYAFHAGGEVKLSAEQREHIVKTLKRAADYAVRNSDAPDPLDIPVKERLAHRKLAMQEARPAILAPV